MLIPRGPHQSCFANRTESARQSRMSHWCCPKFHVLFLSKDNVLWFGIHYLDLTHTCAQHLFGLRHHNVVSFQTDNIRMASREIRAAGFPVMDFSHVWGSFLGESLIKPTMIKIKPARLHFTMVKQLQSNSPGEWFGCCRLLPLAPNSHVFHFADAGRWWSRSETLIMQHSVLDSESPKRWPFRYQHHFLGVNGMFLQQNSIFPSCRKSWIFGDVQIFNGESQAEFLLSLVFQVPEGHMKGVFWGS